MQTTTRIPPISAHQRHLTLAIALILLLSTGMAPASPTDKAAGPTITRQRVLTAINRGIAYLLSHEKPKKFWETASPGQQYWGGPTSLAAYAMLEAGQATGRNSLQPDSKTMRPIIHFLDHLHPVSTYVASLQISALTVFPSHRSAVMHAIRRAAQYLIDSQHSDGAYHYTWSGPKANPVLPGDWDNSNSQYGALGVWAAGTVGINPKIDYWHRCDAHWRTCQNADGGWGYARGAASTRAMTAAGLASLFIVDLYIHNGVHLNPHHDANIQNGLLWLAKNFKTSNNLYYLYGVERVGLASGLRKLGSRNWYRAGAGLIMSQQNQSGAWNGYVLGQPTDAVSTAYALLFLARGLNPIVFNKLAYAGSWDARSHDDANLTQWVGNAFEQTLNWQVVHVKSNPLHWLDAPVLLITGHGDPHFTARDIRHFRIFMDHGGIIFSSADDGSKSFTAAIEKTVRRITHNTRGLTPLKANNWIYHVQFQLPASMGIMGLSNGVRVTWVHSPHDLGADWQGMNDFGPPKLSFELAANVYFYATSKRRIHLHLNPSPPLVSLGAPQRAIHLILASHPGLWNPEPDGWQNLAAIAAARYRTTLITREKPLSNITKADSGNIVYLAGSSPFHLHWKADRQLRSYLNHGGTLVGEAVNASPAFAAAFEKMVSRIYPLAYLEPVPGASGIYNGRITASRRITAVQYRRFYLRYHGFTTRPQLLGLVHHGRYVIIFSPYDISSGLIGTHAWGINGYAPAAARKLLMNMLLYAAADGKTIPLPPERHPKATVSNRSKPPVPQANTGPNAAGNVSPNQRPLPTLPPPPPPPVIQLH